MSHSWLREAVDRVLAEAPHMSDEHKRKLVEAVGLELVRTYARGRGGTIVSGTITNKSLHDFAKLYKDTLIEDEVRALPLQTKEQFLEELVKRRKILENPGSPGENTALRSVTIRCSCGLRHVETIDIQPDLERERARVRFELRKSVQPNRGRDG